MSKVFPSLPPPPRIPQLPHLTAFDSHPLESKFTRLWFPHHWFPQPLVDAFGDSFVRAQLVLFRKHPPCPKNCTPFLLVIKKLFFHPSSCLCFPDIHITLLGQPFQILPFEIPSDPRLKLLPLSLSLQLFFSTAPPTHDDLTASAPPIGVAIFVFRFLFPLFEFFLKNTLPPHSSLSSSVFFL